MRYTEKIIPVFEELKEVEEGFYVPIKDEVVLSTSPVTASNLEPGDVAELLKDSKLSGIEDAVIEVEDTFGINALFTLSVAMLESGHGTSQFAKEKNNLFGMNANDMSPTDAFGYESMDESVLDFGERISKYYIEQGLTRLDTIASKYCPGPNKDWDDKVRTIMEGNINKLS